ncbi:unnamed protein product [Hydatigera taeniaeformis]|uniref:CTNNB1 binding N-teminal domain-containing protein n=1 Tax=Hydatigena taeniaeformis TaxID=6205 RepID=A0A0R3WWJ2_HYDTA|nr:unnamed protein product [Hydatigera taeniaeformis]
MNMEANRKCAENSEEQNSHSSDTDYDYESSQHFDVHATPGCGADYASNSRIVESTFGGAGAGIERGRGYAGLACFPNLDERSSVVRYGGGMKGMQHSIALDRAVCFSTAPF